MKAAAPSLGSPLGQTCRPWPLTLGTPSELHPVGAAGLGGAPRLFPPQVASEHPCRHGSTAALEMGISRCHRRAQRVPRTKRGWSGCPVPIAPPDRASTLLTPYGRGGGVPATPSLASSHPFFFLLKKLHPKPPTFQVDLI